MRKLASLFCLLAACWASGLAQNPNPQTPAPATPAATSVPAARPSDVDSVDHIIAAVYDVISGPAGAPRDWDRFRSLYYPGARLIPSRRDDKGTVTARILSPEEFVARGKDIFASQGFFENPVANRIEAWDHMAHVWSTYESRHAKDEKPFTRGINSFQLINDGTRWWVLTTCWEGEDASHPLPEKYVK